MPDSFFSRGLVAHGNKSPFLAIALGNFDTRGDLLWGHIAPGWRHQLGSHFWAQVPLGFSRNEMHRRRSREQTRG